VSTVRIAGDGGPDTDVWTCSCGLTRPVTGSYGCVDCGDGRPDSWDRIEQSAPLDVERLAEAIFESGVCQTMSQSEVSARNIAAEYARLYRESDR
jgi:hypothetical protein